MDPVGSVTLGGRLGDLVIEAELGRGAFATVYRAQDTLLRRTVAVKVLHDVEQHSGSEAARRMLREARLVGGLTSPNIVTLYRVHTFGADTCVFELEFMDGGSLEERLAAQGRLPADEARRVFLGILAALKTAHDRQVLHRDVKPANVLLGRDGGVKLTDFGLGLLLGEQHLSSQGAARVVGTPAYMAPEVISGGEATPAADLWSAGVVLYRMLAGRLPFEARTLPALFLALSEGVPAPLPGGLPADLAAACTECLRRAPAERPASAAALLSRLEGATSRSAVLRPTGGGRAAVPARAVLFGRDAELARVEVALARLDTGQPAALVLTGAAGSGKSALLREVVERARARAFACVEVACTPGGGIQRPLLAALRRLLGVEDDPRAVAQVTDARFGTAAPLLRDVLASQAPPDLQNAERRVWALESLLAGLAREAPLVLAFDDLQLADADDLKFLLDLRRHLADSLVLPAFAVRMGDADASTEASPLLLRLQQEVSAQPGAALLPLGRLPDDAVYETVRAQAAGGNLDAAVADLVVRRADGNPLHALELFRHLSATGDVVLQDGKHRFRAGWADAGLPPRLRDVMRARLSTLSDDDRGLLDVAAVDGVEVDGPALAAVLERPLLRVLQSLQRLSRQHGLVETDRQGFRFAGAMYRDVVYRELAPDLRRELHRLLAEHLERREDAAAVRPERIGSHWEQAGRPERAREPLLRAAADALRHQENLRATELARRAGLGPDVQDLALVRAHADLAARLSGASFDLGLKAAAESYVRVLGAASAAAGDERLGLRAAVLENELAYLSRGARAVDRDRLRRAAESLAGGRERALACYTLAREAVDARGDGAGAETWLEQAEQICVEQHLRDLHASVIDYRGKLASDRGQVLEAEAHYTESARLCREAGRRTNAAISDVNVVHSRFDRGDLQGLEAPLEASIRVLSRAGFDAPAAHCRVHMARVRYAVGDAAAALDELRAAHDILDRVPSPATRAYALAELTQLRLVRGDLSDAGAALDRLDRVAAEAGQHVAGLRAAALRALWHDVRGEREEAKAAAERALERARGATEARVQAEVATRLAEGGLLGFPALDVPGLRRLLPAVVLARAAAATRAPRLVEALEARQHPQAPTRALHEAAEDLLHAPLGDRRAEHAALGHLVAATAFRRDGEPDRAAEEATAALEGARGLGHVWIQLAALALLDSGEPAAQREALFARVGAALPDDAARERLRARWGRAP